MISFARRRIRNVSITASVLLIATAFYLSYQASQARPELLTGWTLLILVFALAAYNIRKRLSMLPIGSASHYLQAHIYLGVGAVIVFLAHAGWWWSGGVIEGLLFAAFVATAGSGLLGIWLTRILPGRLTRGGEEVIYERIPGFMAQLRDEAEQLVCDTAEDTGSTTLGDFYHRELSHFLAGPRHRMQYLMGAHNPSFMLSQRLLGQGRYLGANERDAHARLLDILDRKAELDFHYALQSALKGWLFVHVPATLAMLLLSLVHLVLVYAFTP